MVVTRFIPMVNRRLKDRVEINARNPEALQIVQVRLDSGEVAAQPCAVGERTVPRCDVFWVVGRVAVGESVGKDLVDHGPLDPAGYFEWLVSGWVEREEVSLGQIRQSVRAEV